jgi:hypothetical protein
MIPNTKLENAKTAGQENSLVMADGMVRRYQRRTLTGVGRTEKTVHSGTAKNPRLLKACNTTDSDIGEFFFISIEDEIVVKAFAAQK